MESIFSCFVRACSPFTVDMKVILSSNLHYLAVVCRLEASSFIAVFPCGDLSSSRHIEPSQPHISDIHSFASALQTGRVIKLRGVFVLELNYDVIFLGIADGPQPSQRSTLERSGDRMWLVGHGGQLAVFGACSDDTYRWDLLARLQLLSMARGGKVVESDLRVGLVSALHHSNNTTLSWVVYRCGAEGRNLSNSSDAIYSCDLTFDMTMSPSKIFVSKTRRIFSCKNGFIEGIAFAQDLTWILTVQPSPHSPSLSVVFVVHCVDGASGREQSIHLAGPSVSSRENDTCLCAAGKALTLLAAGCLFRVIHHGTQLVVVGNAELDTLIPSYCKAPSDPQLHCLGSSSVAIILSECALLVIHWDSVVYGDGDNAAEICSVHRGWSIDTLRSIQADLSNTAAHDSIKGALTGLICRAELCEVGSGPLTCLTSDLTIASQHSSSSSLACTTLLRLVRLSGGNIVDTFGSAVLVLWTTLGGLFTVHASHPTTTPTTATSSSSNHLSTPTPLPTGSFDSDVGGVHLESTGDATALGAEDIEFLNSLEDQFGLVGSNFGFLRELDLVDATPRPTYVPMSPQQQCALLHRVSQLTRLTSFELSDIISEVSCGRQRSILLESLVSRLFDCSPGTLIAMLYMLESKSSVSSSSSLAPVIGQHTSSRSRARQILLCRDLTQIVDIRQRACVVYLLLWCGQFVFATDLLIGWEQFQDVVTLSCRVSLSANFLSWKKNRSLTLTWNCTDALQCTVSGEVNIPTEYSNVSYWSRRPLPPQELATDGWIDRSGRWGSEGRTVVMSAEVEQRLEISHHIFHKALSCLISGRSSVGLIGELFHSVPWDVDIDSIRVCLPQWE